MMYTFDHSNLKMVMTNCLQLMISGLPGGNEEQFTPPKHHKFAAIPKEQFWTPQSHIRIVSQRNMSGN